MFTEKQLKLLKEALKIARVNGLRDFQLDSLAADLDDLLQFERERKRERRKSLAIERRCANA